MLKIVCIMHQEIVKYALEIYALNIFLNLQKYGLIQKCMHLFLYAHFQCEKRFHQGVLY